VALTDYVTCRPARSRREAYSSYRARAKRELERYKGRGGGVVVVDGEIAYRLGRELR
jgi:hypothetical protein